MATELTYKALLARTTALEKRVARNADEIQGSATVIDEEAQVTARESDQIAAKSIDRDSVADSSEFAKVIAGLSEGILTYAARGHDTARQAKAAGEQARTTHSGFQEAFDRSDVDGLENVDRDWFEQQ